VKGKLRRKPGKQEGESCILIRNPGNQEGNLGVLPVFLDSWVPNSFLGNLFLIKKPGNQEREERIISSRL
jgi:hypothetical protein